MIVIKQKNAGWHSVLFLMVAMLVVVSTSPGVAQSTGEPGRDSGQPNPLKNVYFGEQHLHTRQLARCVCLRYAQHIRMTPIGSAKARRSRRAPLARWCRRATAYDWCAVTDHAEYLGMMPLLLDPNSPLRDTPIGKLMAAGQGRRCVSSRSSPAATAGEMIPYLADPEVMATAWQRTEGCGQPALRARQVHHADRALSGPPAELCQSASQRLLSRQRGAAGGLLVLRLGQARGSLDLSGDPAAAGARELLDSPQRQRLQQPDVSS